MHCTTLLSILACCSVVFGRPGQGKSENTNGSKNSSGTSDGCSNGKRAVGFYGNWDIYARNFTVPEIPASQLTHVSYAFCNINSTTGEVYLSDEWADLQFAYPGDETSSSNSTKSTGTSNSTTATYVYGNVKQLFLLKKKNRTLKTMLSVGGWTFSPNWSAMLADEEKRAVFASSAVKLMTDLGFDGLDYDYEYVTNTTQAADLIDLLDKTRTLMDEYANEHGTTRSLLTFDCPAGPLKYTLLDMEGMDQYLDFWNFMAFDYAGSWDTYAGHSQNIYGDESNNISTPFNTSTGIDYYLANGVSASKINLGSPLYGHAFLNTKGPGQPFSGTGLGSFGESGGNWDYKALPMTGANLTAVQIIEREDIGASYSYDSSSMMMVSYDTPKIAKQKAQWAMEKGLGGAMWWEVSQDKSGEDSLIAATVEEFGGLEESLNNLDYPTSIYENLRNGFPDN